MSDNVVNFLKYQLKRDFIDPTDAYIVELTAFFKQHNFKAELELMKSFQEIYKIYVEELEKVDWVECMTPSDVWSSLQGMTIEIEKAIKKRIDEMGKY
jgi:hypothetical protein